MPIAMDAQANNEEAGIPEYESAATAPGEAVLTKGPSPSAVSVLLEVDVYSAP